ncbi:MAG: hypothetical protein HKP58_07605 [Desulfatitalea sp.]|nr:outer membrane protein transport protein [Desulfatitalea sp.]NNK00264.1 hypothetical protein [Desulfatitalea sp.]
MGKTIGLIGILGWLLLSVSSLHAGGFALTEKGVKGQGTSYSGGAAAAQDASTIYWNPAGMTRLETNEAAAALLMIKPSFTFKGESATNLLGAPIQPAGADGGDAGFYNYVPNLFLSYHINEKWVAGLGVVVPFGLGTEYDANWVGRYHTVKSNILSFDINPSVAWRINDQWSVGAGVSFQYLSAELTNAIDFGLASALSPALGAAFPGLTPSTPGSDGFAKLEGESWAYGFNLGVLVELSGDSRIGLSYRSQVQHDVDGNTEFTDPAGATGISLAAFGGNQDSEAKIDLPATASLSAYHQINVQWAVMADITWTGWNSMEELKVTSNGGAPDSITTLNWEDTWRMAAGVNWFYSEAWTFRSGLAYDPTPVPNAEERTPRVPDEDRFWLSMGGTRRLTPSLSLDFAATYLWTLDNPELNKVATATNENNLRGNLKGSYDADSIILGVQLNYLF